MTQKYANAARAELAATINGADASLTIVDGGSLFPVANTGASAISSAADWFKLTIQDDAGIEIVFVRTHASGSTSFSDILRGQEGTTAREFLAGSVVGVRPTAGDAAAYALDAELDAVASAKQDKTSVDDSAPASPVNGQAWVQGTTGIKFTWVEDGTSGQWVEFGPGGSKSAWADITGKPAVIAAGADAAAARAAIGAASTSIPKLTGLREAKVAMAANDIDLSAGNVFTKTISGATTLTVSNVPAAGDAASFILKLTNGGSAVVTWWAGVKHPGGTPPTLTVSGRDNLYFETDDGGASWDCTVVKDVK